MTEPSLAGPVPSIVCLETGSRSARESSSKHGEAVTLQGDHLTIQWPLEILQESGNLPPAATTRFLFKWLYALLIAELDVGPALQARCKGMDDHPET